MPLCFAYGSNMDEDAMAIRCPASKPLGMARLPRHRWAIMREGYATVVPDPRRTVWGLLWNVALADVAALDRYEEVGRGLYSKAERAVITADGPRRALVYLGRDAGPGAARPGYVEGVVAAGRKLGLPDTYLAEIAGWLSERAAVIAEPRIGMIGRPAVRPTRRAPTDNNPVERRPGRWQP